MESRSYTCIASIFKQTHIMYLWHSKWIKLKLHGILQLCRNTVSKFLHTYLHCLCSIYLYICSLLKSFPSRYSIVSKFLSYIVLNTTIKTITHNVRCYSFKHTHMEPCIPSQSSSSPIALVEFSNIVLNTTIKTIRHNVRCY